MKRPSEEFPEILWKADYNTIHLSRHLISNYIGSENYALYTNLDGTIVDRIHIGTLNINYFKTKKEALEEIKFQLKRKIDSINDKYLKIL